MLKVISQSDYMKYLCDNNKVYTVDKIISFEDLKNKIGLPKYELVDISGEFGMIKEIDYGKDKEALQSYKDKKIEEINKIVSTKLQETDWIVVKYCGQLTAGMSTSLTEKDFKALEKSRQKIRDWGNDTEKKINKIKKIEILNVFEIKDCPE